MSVEAWVPIREFPSYEVSTWGRIQNGNTHHIMTPSLNQRGIPNVILAKDLRYYRRSVAPLVADAFLPDPKQHHYTTPINLDGDRTNNDIRNLMWRPLWFARKYHHQFTEPWAYDGPVEIVETGEFFDRCSDMVKKYGLLERDILHAGYQSSVVPNLWRHVRLKIS